MPPIIPRERFGADRRDPLRIGDILIGQARANPRPCLPEFQFAVVEVGAGLSVIAALRLAVDVAGPVHCGRSCGAPLPGLAPPTTLTIPLGSPESY
jgi:hypothetical protein